ncbi:MAG: PQQ-binding-like beta-propeller repeat protein [Verrucomicrobiota bacterium]
MPTLTRLTVLLALSLTGVLCADDWPQWRGPLNSGFSATATPPLEWSESKNLAWKREIEGNGTSSPIVLGDKVFLTTAVNTGEVDPSLPRPEDQPERVFGIKHPNTSYQLIAMCIHRDTGELLWRDIAKTYVPHEGHHKDASFASSSAATDGERVFFWFGSGGIYAYDLDGTALWAKDLPPAKVGASLGEGSTPAIHDGRLILVRDHAGQSTISALDTATGETLWTTDRQESNTWATPAIVERDGVTQVITPGTTAVRSYDLADGSLIWQATGLTNNCAPCPIVRGDTAYCMTGYKGHALLAIPLTGKGDVTDQIQWRADKGTPYVPSALLYDDQLYFTQSNQGILTSLSATDGKELIERTRVPDLSDVYASPVGADGRVYFVGRKGTTVVLAHDQTFRVLATNQLDDRFHASPAIAGDQIFLRGMDYLYCLQSGATGNGAHAIAAPKLPPAKVAEPKADPLRDLLVQIAQRPVPEDYPGGAKHQSFVDAEIAKFTSEQKQKIGTLWKAQQRLFPDTKKKGLAFIRILDHVRQ